MVTVYKFNAKELDQETGLYYYGARYYSPELSIWASVDPLSDKYPSMSPFMYCAGNPVVLVDPDGRDIVPTNEAGNRAITTYLGSFSNRAQRKAFGLQKKTGTDNNSGNYPIYTSIYKGISHSPSSFKKALGRDGKKMSDTEIKEAYSFYLGLVSDKQFKVEGWSPGSRPRVGEGSQGSQIVDFVAGFAPREVNNNTDFDMDFLENDFDKIFNSKGKSSDPSNIFGDGFNFYTNFVRNPTNPNDRNTEGVIVIDTRKQNWSNILGKAFKVLFE